MDGIHAVLLANRPMPALAILSREDPPVLLPLGGKSLIVHALEDLAQAKIRRATIVCPVDDPASVLALHAALGDGVRWGLELEYIMASPEAVSTAPFDVIKSERDTLLLMELDRARSPFVERIIAAPARQSPVRLEVLTTGGSPALERLEGGYVPGGSAAGSPRRSGPVQCGRAPPSGRETGHHLHLAGFRSVLHSLRGASSHGRFLQRKPELVEGYPLAGENHPRRSLRPGRPLTAPAFLQKLSVSLA